jgi:acyl-CoA thioester hydrolase
MEERNIQFFHQSPVQIRFNDIDGLGHVNNTTIQEYFDLGRVEYFKAVFGGQVNWNEFAAIIASIKTDFAFPVFINDRLIVQTKITNIGNKSMQLLQHLTDEDKNIKAKCESTMVGFDHKNQSSAIISDEWRKLINNIERDAKF